MAKSAARRGSPLPPWWTWWACYVAARRVPRRKGHWQRPDVFANRPGWDTDPHHYARADTKRRAIEDQRG